MLLWNLENLRLVDTILFQKAGATGKGAISLYVNGEPINMSFNNTNKKACSQMSLPLILDILTLVTDYVFVPILGEGDGRHRVFRRSDMNAATRPHQTSLLMEEQTT